ncbi:MAG TPA: InlB B-repeat-containing protein [Oscillospiraceae bacterium]|nr:InlB B-repeat-containing protein [Oscillospiraceae bacterium]HPS35159.1 InlB B-repeat-containing protein [Oscillospiraceae bacterium]
MKYCKKLSAILISLIFIFGLFSTTVFATTDCGCPLRYHIYYNGNGNTAGSQSESSGWDWENLKVKDQGTLSKTGYTFNGWNTVSDGSGESFLPGDDICFIISSEWIEGHWFLDDCHPIWIPGHWDFEYGDRTLYAQWNINQYTMSFDSRGGSPVAPITQNYNTTVAAPAAPTRDHYSFGGWVDSLNNPISFPYTLVEDITVYAEWQIDSYTMMFDSEGGSSVTPITQNYNTQVIKPEDPTKYGFTFSGWYTGENGTGTLVNFPHTLTDNITVHAKWTAQQFTVSFDSEGGSSVSSVSGNYGEFISSFAIPTKNGFTFEGWYSGDNGTGTLISVPYMITGNVTVYAKWKMINVVSEPSSIATSSISNTVSSPASSAVSSRPTTNVGEGENPTTVPGMGNSNLNMAWITAVLFSMLVLAGIILLRYKKHKAAK